MLPLRERLPAPLVLVIPVVDERECTCIVATRGFWGRHLKISILGFEETAEWQIAV